MFGLCLCLCLFLFFCFFTFDLWLYTLVVGRYQTMDLSPDAAFSQ